MNLLFVGIVLAVVGAIIRENLLVRIGVGLIVLDIVVYLLTNVHIVR